MTTLKSRRVIVENLGTRDHPTPRRRIATPLTPRAVRQQMLRAPEWLEDAKAAEWLEERRAELPSLLTELDRLLIDEEALALERYCANEEMLGGSARCADYAGDRVQTSPSRHSPLADDAFEALSAHAVVKKRLGELSRAVLLIFLTQQCAWDGAPTAAQAAIMLGLPGKRRHRAWWLAVRDAARELAAAGY